MSYAKKALVGASALLMGTSALPALSHTNAIGYVGDGTGGVTFWYGTYHVGTQFNEAELKLEGANGTSYTTTINQFNLLEQTLPAGLDPNTNYFTTDGTQLVPWDASIAPAGGTYTWQGFNVVGLAAGDYTFTYIPLGNAESYDPTGTPTMEWAPIDEVIRTYTVSLSAGLISGDANQNGILDIYEFGTVTTPPPSSTPTVVSSAAGTPIVTTSTSSGTRTETSTQDRYVFDTVADTRTYYVDTVVTTIPTTTTVTSTTPTTVDTYSDGSTVTTNGTTTTSSSTSDSGAGTSVVTQATVPVWVETRTYDVQRTAYAPSGAAPTVVNTHRYTPSENGNRQKVNHHTTTGITTPTVRTVTTTAVYTRVHTDGSPDLITTDPSVITYETSTSYAESYASKDYFGRIDQLQTLDKVALGSNRLLNHLPSRTNQKVRVFNNNRMMWSNTDGYDAFTSSYGGGLEIDLSKGWTIGGQYNTLNTKLNGTDSTSNMNREHFGVFNSFHGKHLSLITNGGYSNDKYNYSRNVEGVFDNSGRTEGNQWWVNNRLYAHLGRSVHPFIGHTVRNVTRNAYTESGDSRSARSVAAYDKTTHVGEAGLRLETRFGGKKGDLIGMSVEGSYATDNSYDVVAAVDLNQVIYIEGSHGNVDGVTNNTVAAKVKFRF